jgi:DNA topoisomerase-1
VRADVRRGAETCRLLQSHGIWENKAEADAIFARVRDAKQATVLEYVQEETRRRPPIPFSTTLFVAEATRLGLGAATVMRIAEDLYTQGLISYPRTDNTV